MKPLDEDIALGGFGEDVIAYERLDSRHLRVTVRRRRWLFWSVTEQYEIERHMHGRFYWRRTGVELRLLPIPVWNAIEHCMRDTSRDIYPLEPL